MYKYIRKIRDFFSYRCQGRYCCDSENERIRDKR